MNREQTIANAKIWLEANTQMRWTTEAVGVEKDYSLNELNARCDRRAEQLADFHIAMSAERDAEIADKLDAMPFVWGKEMRDFIDELRGKK